MLTVYDIINSQSLTTMTHGVSRLCVCLYMLAAGYCVGVNVDHFFVPNFFSSQLSSRALAFSLKKQSCVIGSA
jgi:hypothetical protein